MTPDERWLASMWEFVRTAVPPPPARVAEVGCGPQGGFVPMLRFAGYEAAGIDPEAPPGAEYWQVEFERHEMPEPADAIVACTSLHHVRDLGRVLDLCTAALVPGGRLVVVEWARERFDDPTARWCFSRLPADGSDSNWLAELRATWRDSGLPWDVCCRSWAEAEGLHSGQDILRQLDERFDAERLSYGPYFFADLDDTTEDDEQAAIDRGQIQANRVQYVGRRR